MRIARMILLMGLAVLVLGLSQQATNVPPIQQVHATKTKPPQPVQEPKKPEPVVTAPPAVTPAPEPVAAPQPVPAPSPAPVSSNAAKAFIYAHESGNNPLAVNASSGACGLGQSLPCAKVLAACPNMEYECQDAWFTNYALSRYGSWEAAYQFWLIHRWW